MIEKGISQERFQPRTCSGKKASKAGVVKENGKNVVLIDIDNDQVEDVVIIDDPEFMQQKCHGPSEQRREGKCPFQSVISIDDDDSDDADYTATVAEGGGELDSDASSSKRFSSATGHMQNSVHIDVDDYDVPHEKSSAFNMPKSWQTPSAESAGRNHCNLDNESEIESTESDCSDCEVVEVCDQWEKASVQRKRRVFNSRAGFDEQASSSGFHGDIYTNVEVENRMGQQSGSPVHSHSRRGNFMKENFSMFSGMGDSQVDGTYFNFCTESPCNDSYNVDQERFNFSRPGSGEQTQHGESARDYSPCSRFGSYHFTTGVTGSSQFRKEVGDKESNFVSLSQEESKRQVDENGSASRNKDDNYFEARYDHTSFSERHVNHDETVSPQSCERHPNSGLGAKEKSGTSPEVSFCCNSQSLGKSRACSSEAELTAESEVISMSNVSCNGLQDKMDRSCLAENEKPSEVGAASHSQDKGVSQFTASNERDVINEREKLKETDEYKRAMEEEWASRQRQLQIQKEEAQRLRKRKKAESQRLLDMQRRQKERIEEVRETQKKDEENMNMKEQLRNEIRKELLRMEITCMDMASLLRSLGIQVGGGLKPSSHEVNVAYKRALFKFHPDRASKTDIRDQVEAEEKFKLISRMKEKLLSTSVR